MHNLYIILRRGENISNHVSDKSGECRDGDSMGQAGGCVHLLIEHTRDSDMASPSHVRSSGLQNTGGSCPVTEVLGPGSVAVPLQLACPSSTESTYTGTWPAEWHHQAFPPPAHPEIQLKHDDLQTVLCLLQPHAVNCPRKSGHTNNLCPTKKVK